MLSHRVREMRTEDGDRLVSITLEESLAGGHGGRAVIVERRDPVGTRNLTGVMHHVASDDRFFTLGSNVHTDMAGRVAGCRFEPHTGADLVIGFDEIDQTRLEHRLHGFLEYRPEVVLVVLPMIEFGLNHHIPRVRKCRHPFAVDLLGIPTDMIDMQMGADHGVDGIRVVAEFFQVVDEGALHVGPRFECEILVVTDAGIDHHLAVRSLDDHHLDVEDEFAVGRDEMRLQPRDGGEIFRRCVGQHRHRAAVVLELDELSDSGIAEFPLEHGCSPPEICERLVWRLARYSGASIPRTRQGWRCLSPAAP